MKDTKTNRWGKPATSSGTSRSKTVKPKRRVYIPLPDHRNVARGKEWLRKMIKASEEKKLIESVVDEMAPVVKREREPGEDDNL